MTTARPTAARSSSEALITCDGSIGTEAGRIAGLRYQRPLPVRLVAVHPAVGCREQRLVGVAVVREDGGADADAELHALAWTRLEHDLVNRRLQLQPLSFRLVSAAAGQHDDELVAGVAHADVVRPDGGAQDPCELAQAPGPRRDARGCR